MAKPRITTRCVANTYTSDSEVIAEFIDRVTNQGGLISFRRQDGWLDVSLYALDANVRVRVSDLRGSVQREGFGHDDPIPGEEAV